MQAQPIFGPLCIPPIRREINEDQTYRLRRALPGFLYVCLFGQCTENYTSNSKNVVHLATIQKSSWFRFPHGRSNAFWHPLLTVFSYILQFPCQVTRLCLSSFNYTATQVSCLPVWFRFPACLLAAFCPLWSSSLMWRVLGQVAFTCFFLVVVGPNRRESWPGYNRTGRPFLRLSSQWRNCPNAVWHLEFYYPHLCLFLFGTASWQLFFVSDVFTSAIHPEHTIYIVRYPAQSIFVCPSLTNCNQCH